MSVPAVELIGIQVQHREHVALDVPYLSLESGTTLTLMGPNGAGKSTLLRIIGLLQRPARGRVLHNGEPTGRDRHDLRRRRRLAIVMQRPFLTNASTFDNVAAGLRYRGVPGGEVKRRVNAWLDRLGISHLAGRNTRQLSGGEAQRASLARGLVLEPDLLLLDEPFSALDEPTKLALQDDLWEILREIHTTTLFVTHNRTEARVLSDQLGVIIGGRLRQVGRADDVFNRPVSEDVATFVGMENILTAKVSERLNGLNAAKVNGADIAFMTDGRPGDELVVGVRPESVLVEPANGTGSSAGERNRVHGQIARMIPVGTQVRVVVDCGFPLVSLMAREETTEMSLGIGTPVVVRFDSSAVHVIRNAGESADERSVPD